MATLKTSLGQVDVPGTGTLTLVYQVPAGQEASINLTIANRADTPTNIRVALIKAAGVGSVANEDYLMYDIATSLFTDNRSPIQINGIVMGALDTIAVYSSAVAVSCNANGIEKAAS
jgi:hypothetical protein